MLTPTQLLLEDLRNEILADPNPSQKMLELLDGVQDTLEAAEIKASERTYVLLETSEDETGVAYKGTTKARSPEEALRTFGLDGQFSSVWTMSPEPGFDIVKAMQFHLGYAPVTAPEMYQDYEVEAIDGYIGYMLLEIYPDEIVTVYYRRSTTQHTFIEEKKE